ncbi:MAG: HAD family phosphatase [Muribaculaceae bacterium]|nr:HAD family phosphatase [Muribaculaceae bacterium]
MIKNLLFDLGGVIMDIEKDRCVEAFARLDLPDAPSYFGEYSQKGPFMLLEEGAITTDEFHRSLREDIRRDVTDAEIDHAFCQFLIGIPPHRLAELRKLRENYRIYLLSNTNPIMWNSTIRDEFTKEGRMREDYFDGMVTSFEARSLKPDEKIFRYAEQHLGIKPEETIFLDDSQRNLDAAARLGFHTLLVAPGTEFATLLAAEGIK